MPNNKIWKKGLVVGIIVLFIGVGFQPAFANEVSITNKTSDVEEDCNCNPVSNLHLIRLERMLNRLEIHTKILSIFSKYNPEFKEKYQEISNRISTLKETNNELKLGSSDWDYPIICEILLIIITPVDDLALYIIEILEGDVESFLDAIIRIILTPIMASILFLYFYLLAFGVSFGCLEFPDL